MQELDEIWLLVLEELKKKHSETFISLWISDLKLVSLTDTYALFYIQSDFKRGMLEKKHCGTVLSALEAVIGYKVSIYFTSDAGMTEPNLNNKDTPDSRSPVSNAPDISESVNAVQAQTHTPPAPPPAANAVINESAAVRQPFSEASDRNKEGMTSDGTSGETHGFSFGSGISSSISSGLNSGSVSDINLNLKSGSGSDPDSIIDSSSDSHASEYTFDNFIVGSSNKFAYAACTAVAQRPAHSYNPLFIYGPSGLGKTHLLYAITNEVKKNNPDYIIIYVKGEEFTNQMIESISRGTTMKFREKYRKANVLLIDDVHFIAGKESTQEEFFHTFNDLYEHKKQIILTSDRPVKDIQKLEERLRTRFEWGLTADIQPPDFELRVAIMKKKAEDMGSVFPSDVLEFLAEKLTNNIRQMEGAIKKIIAYSFLSGEEISVPLATSCISDLLSAGGTVKVTPEKIVAKVAAKYGVDPGDIYSKKKANDISRARHISIYLLRKISDLSYPNIGRLLNRDHSTVMSSYKIMEQEIKIDSSFELEINDLIKEITTQGY